MGEIDLCFNEFCLFFVVIVCNSMLFEKKFKTFFFTKVWEYIDHYKCSVATVIKLDTLHQIYFRLSNSSVWSTKPVDDLLYWMGSKNGFKRSSKTY